MNDFGTYGPDEAPIEDREGVTHGWARFRTAVDDYEDETWCGLRVPDYPTKDRWAYRENGVIDCMQCIAKGSPNAG